jgi:multidrug efflux pump subunit AcrB
MTIILVATVGKSFLILMPDTNLEHATIIAERIRVQISKLTFEPGDFQITVSIGVSSHKSETALEMINEADLSAGSKGYGIFLETSLNESNKDSDSIIQFDPGLGTMIAKRERVDGKEKAHETINVADYIEEADFVRDENGEYIRILNKKGKFVKVRSNWWSEEHTMSLEVESIDENTKGVKIYIDDIAIFNADEYSYVIDSNKEDKTYTGFRTWSGDVEFSGIEYKNLD